MMTLTFLLLFFLTTYEAISSMHQKLSCTFRHRAYLSSKLVMVLKLLLLLCLLNTTLKVLTSGELGCVHKRNKQGRFGKEISHLLKRAVGSLGEDCPKVNSVGKVADLRIVSQEFD